MNLFLDILRRTLAVIILKVTGVFAGGFGIGLEVWQAAAMAAIAGVIEVAQALSRSYLSDGFLDIDEVNRTFGSIADKAAPNDGPAEEEK